MPFLRMVKKSPDWHKVQFIDTHCHLDFNAYKNDLTEVITRAVDAGVTRILVPGLNLESSQMVVRLTQQHTEIYGAVGIHPSDVNTWQPGNRVEFEELLSHEKVVAVGEIGLDFYHRQDNFTQQLEVLRHFLELAIDHDKPVILHSRNCLPDLIDVIKKYQTTASGKKLRGVWHAFEGNLTDALQLTTMGFFIGAGGPVTYKNAAIKHEVFSKIDLSHVLLETDGPFLSPQSHRGQRNEPAWIPLIAQRIADLRLCDIKEVADATSDNAKKLFNWTT